MKPYKQIVLPTNQYSSCCCNYCCLVNINVINIVSTILSLYSCVFLQDKDTALHYAAMEGSNNVITFLLHHGAGVDHVDKVSYHHMYHFAWANQREKQGYKSDVSLKRGIQICCTVGK